MTEIASAERWPALHAAGVWDLLSERGRRAELIEGVRTWVERARVAEVDGTIGVLAGTSRELDEAHGVVVEHPAAGRTPEGEGARRTDGPLPEDRAAGLVVQDGAGERATIFHLSALRSHFPQLSPAEIFPYTPVAGTAAFRDAWRAWLLHKSGRVDDPGRVRRLTTHPIATPGVSGALFTCGHLFLDPGEALVVADKRWDGYDTAFGAVLGAELVAHRLFTADGRLDVESFAQRLADVARRQAKVTAILNFPNNPTGYTPSVVEVKELRSRVRRVVEETGKPLVLLFDDAYEGFVYDDAAFPVSLFYGFVGLHPLCTPLKCDGITKELLFWGGRLGALTLGLREPEGGAEEQGGGSADLQAEWESKCSGVLRAVVSSSSTPVQAMVAKLLRDRLPEALAERERMIALLQRRRERLRALLDDAAAREVFRVDPFNGGLFALLNLRRGSASEVAARALREHKVGVVPFEDATLGVNALRLTFGSVPEAQLERLVSALVASAGVRPARTSGPGSP